MMNIAAQVRGVAKQWLGFATALVGRAIDDAELQRRALHTWQEGKAIEMRARARVLLQRPSNRV